ncbi:MAG: hypothetical protein VX938_01430, partial [Myxococcota bacterium]|nr:hypothetical protein [Myxococcota bacterium]
LSLVACVSGPTSEQATTGCTPLQVVACVCDDGTFSNQACDAQGISFGPCDCAAAPPNSQTSCAPNTQQACLCADGSSGVQWCDVTGMSYGACSCEPTSDPGPCVATKSDAYQGCMGQDVVWFDDCDQPGATLQTCTGGSVCVDGQCLSDCKPEAGLYCLNDAITWYDTCDQPGVQTEVCSPDKICQGCTIDQKPCTSPPVCTAASFDGTWELVATPATLDNCGAPKTYPGSQFLVLSTNGNVATGVIDNAIAYGSPVNFTGTVNSKYLSVEASYSEAGPPSVGNAVTYDHAIDVELTSEITFAGTHALTYTQNAGTTCTWLWSITGARQ